MITTRTHGIQAKIFCCIGSMGAVFIFCWSHMVTPTRMGRMPIRNSPGGVNGSRPNRLTGVSGSGAVRSWIHKVKGWWRISTETISTL